MKLIDNAREKWWRLWSVRLQSIGLTIQTLFMTWGEFPLTLWNMMPNEVRHRVPERAVFILPAAFFLAGTLARFIKQEKLHGDQAND